ncbi:MAG TPA: ABC transporter permease [Gemmatimonadaceae bacterium]|nr:ABC transporter permease [Gemmatimonadaceae bacterium]
MPFFEAIRLALAQIRVQKLKSFFTLLGVTIGVMFLIAVVSIVEGMGRYVEQDFAAKFLGVNTFNLRRFPDIQTGDVTEATWRSWQRRPPITEADAYAVRAALPPEARWAIDDVDWADPVSDFVKGGPQVLAHATTADIFAIKSLVITSGRAFTEQENFLAAPVVVVGKDVAEHYFPNLDPIGRELKIRGIPFRVIGVLEKQGSVFGLSLDRQLYAPFRSPLGRLVYNPRGGLYGVVVQAPDARSLQEVQEQVRELMRKRRKLRPSQEDDFAFETAESALTQWATIKQYLVYAGIVLPAIGLVVGAIVIMNIMLVAVAERTREIGIRKSLGARRRDILAQFHVEAATLSTVGAAIGIGMGVGLAKLVSALSPLPANVAMWSVVLAVAIGAGVGILAGLYPASRAARLDPIAALRSE